MPSTLPIIKARTKQINIDKMKFIADYNYRSVSKELELIIEKHIKDFEDEHGEIIFDWLTPNEIINKTIDKLTGNA